MPSAPAAPYTAPQAPQSAPAPASDSFLDRLSNQSLEVVQHFGAEAPAILNSYACVLEDGLIQQAQQTEEARNVAIALHEQLGNAHTVIAAAAEDNAAFQTLLSDPRLLANYTNDFFGPNGVYPVITPQDRLRAEVEAGESGQGMPAPRAQLAPSYQGQVQPQQSYQSAPAPIQYERPQMEIQAPIQAIQRENGGELQQFSALFDRDPAAASAALHTLSPSQLASMLSERGAMLGE
jgi:Mor family transcriptional regulator